MAVIGVLLGVGFYAAALLLALLCALSMSVLPRIVARLPGRAAMDVTLTFREGYPPNLEEVGGHAAARGYLVLRETLSITAADGQPTWRFSVVAIERSRAVSPALLAEGLSSAADIASFSIAPVRS